MYSYKVYRIFSCYASIKYGLDIGLIQINWTKALFLDFLCILVTQAHHTSPQSHLQRRRF